MSSWLDSMIEKNWNYYGKLYAKNMLRRKEKDNVIMEVTDITKKELKELKKELAMEK